MSDTSSRLTTLILGAGLGKEYGFPDGPGLRQQIINELEDRERNLREILEWSPAETVDEIAATHPEHADRIRRLVVTILRRCENPALLQQAEKPNTYKLMLKQIAAAQAKGDSVKIITFNYDRSLQYLLHRINGIMPVDRKIDPSIITSIYGRLALLDFEDPNRQRRMTHHTYGVEPDYRVYSVPSQDLDPFAYDDMDEAHRHQEQQMEIEAEEDLQRCSKIRFIGELNGPPTAETSETLQNSSQIFLLGIGYHRANLALLGLDFTKRHPQKLIVGTGLGLSQEYITSLKEMYPALTAIEPCDAHTFLKSKFDISDMDSNLRKRSLSTFDVL